MKYMDMVKSAQASGRFSDKQMWKSIESVSEMMDRVKECHPELYWGFMREQAGIMNGCHYDEIWSAHDVSKITYTDRDGKKQSGAYWTCEQIEEATKGMTFPSGVTKWDKFVAFNIAKSDFCKKFDDAQIINIGFMFFFADEDWESDGKASSTKTWEYMCCKYRN